MMILLPFFQMSNSIPHFPPGFLSAPARKREVSPKSLSILYHRTILRERGFLQIFALPGHSGNYGITTTKYRKFNIIKMGFCP
jgi:hypothetical protein